MSQPQWDILAHSIIVSKLNLGVIMKHTHICVSISYKFKNSELEKDLKFLM